MQRAYYIVHALALAKLTCAVLYSTRVAREVAWHLSATVEMSSQVRKGMHVCVCTCAYAHTYNSMHVMYHSMQLTQIILHANVCVCTHKTHTYLFYMRICTYKTHTYLFYMRMYVYAHTRHIHIYFTCEYTVLDIKRVENSIFHSMYIFSVILHAIDKQDIST